MGIITTNYVKQYENAVAQQVQAGASKLSGAVVNDTLVGEEGYYEQLGPSSMKPRGSRGGRTQWTDRDNQRRRVTSAPFSDSTKVSKADRARILIQPEGPYVRSMAMGAGRQRDQLIIDAFQATAYGGKDGTDTFSPLSAMEVAVDFGGSSEGLTADKIIEAAELLRNQGADPGMETWYFTCAAKQLSDALRLEKFTSADYSTVRALMSGEIDTFMGFKWIVFGAAVGRNAILPITAGDIRDNYAWSETGMLLAIADDVTATVDRLPDFENDIGIITQMDMGATRLEEERVVRVLCDESP